MVDLTAQVYIYLYLVIFSFIFVKMGASLGVLRVFYFYFYFYFFPLPRRLWEGRSPWRFIPFGRNGRNGAVCVFFFPLSRTCCLEIRSSVGRGTDATIGVDVFFVSRPLRGRPDSLFSTPHIKMVTGVH